MTLSSPSLSVTQHEHDVILDQDSNTLLGIQAPAPRKSVGNFERQEPWRTGKEPGLSSHGVTSYPNATCDRYPPFDTGSPSALRVTTQNGLGRKIQTWKS